MQLLLLHSIFCVFAFAYGMSTARQEQTSSCVSCITTVNHFKQKLGNVSSSEAYSNVKKLCDQKGDLSSICNEVDSEVFTKFYNNAKGLDSSKVCYVMEECVDAVVDAALEAYNNRPPSFNNPCDMCQKILKKIPVDVTQELMTKALKVGCEDLNNLKSKCEQTIDRSFPLVYGKFFDGLYNFLPLCTFMGYCPGPGVFSPAVRVHPTPTIPRLPATTKAPIPVDITGIVDSPLADWGASQGNVELLGNAGAAAGLAGLAGLLGTLAGSVGPLLPAFAFAG